MACEIPVVFKPCNLLGKGLTSQAVSEDATTIQLMKGHGSRFPAIPNGKHFYVRVAGCDSCCEIMKVVAKTRDKLTVERNSGSKCTCIKSNASVEMDYDNAYYFADLISVIPLKVVDPLEYNCATNTLSVNCSKLFSSDCGCGTGSAATATAPVTGGGGGLRGPKGDKGDPGVGIGDMRISPAGQLLMELENGRVITVGTIPVPKSVPGPRGERGPEGPTGPQGPAGTSFQSGSVDENGIGVFNMSDGTNIQIAGLKGPKGDKGDQGDTGPRGPQGEDGDNGVTIAANTDTLFLSGMPSRSYTVENITKPTSYPVTVQIGSDGLGRAPYGTGWTKGDILKVKYGNMVVGVAKI